MNGWDHVVLTTIVFFVSWIAIYFLAQFLIIVFPAYLSLWFVFVAWVGGIFPDFDIHWKPLLGHRSVITHSVIAPLLIVGIFFLPIIIVPGLWMGVDRYFIVIFLLGCALHLLLDLFPSSRSVLNRFMKNPLEAFAYIEKNQTAAPGNITKIPEKYERGWLIGNAVALIFFAAFLWLFLPIFFP